MNGMKKLNRRFSLDSSGYSLGNGGLLGKPRGGRIRMTSQSSKAQSLEEAQLEILEFSKSLSKPNLVRRGTIEQESFDRPDGSITRSSFKNHNKTFHKIFPEISNGTDLTHAFTCALQKEVLYHGKLYVSDRHVCFHSSVLLKATKVVIHVPNVQSVRKRHTARVVPNALSIITNDGDKYMFVSLRNRDICFQLLQSVCPQIQVDTANGSPQMSSTENGQEQDMDTISSFSSQDSIDQRLSEDNNLPPEGFLDLADLSKGPERSSSSPRSSISKDGQWSEDEDKDISWVSVVTEKAKSFLRPRESSNLNTLLIIYLILVVLLLFSSGYIGLRIVALEEQLGSLGDLPPFSLQTECKET